MTVVYWIFDETCRDVQSSGYVGVSKDAAHRFRAHLRNHRVPSNSQYVIVFEGSREDCFAYERKLRPQKNVGWNNAVGGAQGWRVGFSHSDDTRAKMREAKRGYKQSAEHIANRVAATKGQKRPKQSLAMTGSRNPMFGTKRPAHVIEAVRKAHLGKPSPRRQEIYCVGCHERVNKTTLAKYHNKCFRAFVARGEQASRDMSRVLRGELT